MIYSGLACFDIHHACNRKSEQGTTDHPCQVEPVPCARTPERPARQQRRRTPGTYPSRPPATVAVGFRLNHRRAQRNRPPAARDHSPRAAAQTRPDHRPPALPRQLLGPLPRSRSLRDARPWHRRGHACQAVSTSAIGRCRNPLLAIRRAVPLLVRIPARSKKCGCCHFPGQRLALSLHATKPHGRH